MTGEDGAAERGERERRSRRIWWRISLVLGVAFVLTGSIALAAGRGEPAEAAIGLGVGIVYLLLAWFWWRQLRR